MLVFIALPQGPAPSPSDLAKMKSLKQIHKRGPGRLANSVFN